MTRRPMTLLPVLLLTTTLLRAQTAPTTTPADPAFTHLAQTLTEAFNKGDADALVPHLAPNLLITWPDGHVSHTPADVKEYLAHTRTDRQLIYGRITLHPALDYTHLDDPTHATVAGKLNESYAIADGSDFSVNSRFTATLTQTPTGQWQLTTLHAAAPLFDNPVLRTASQRSVPMAIAGGAFLGLTIGILLGILVGRRRAIQIIQKPETPQIRP